MSRFITTAISVAALTFLAAGCSDEGGNEDEGDSADTVVTAIADPNAAPVDGAFFSVVEVGLGEDGYVTIENFTDNDHSLDTYLLCQEDVCVDLPDAVVGAGRVARIALGSGGDLDDLVMTDADVGVLSPADGELVLYRSSERTVGTLIDYYQWGSDPHATTDDAIEASLWIEGSYGPTGDDAVRLWLDAESGLWLWDAAS